jgi:hypothetical protein
MHKFERFIIYPMLLIAIFFSFADDGVQQTTAQQVYDEIIAKSIKIVNSEGEVLVLIDSSKMITDTKKVYGEISIKNTKKDNLITLSAGTINPVISISEEVGGVEDDPEYDYNVLNISDNSLSVFEYSTFQNEYKSNRKFDLRGNTLQLYNKKGDKTIYIGQNENGHGLIYDKYVEE